MTLDKRVEEKNILLQEAKELDVECPHGNWIGWCDNCDPRWSDYIKTTLQKAREEAIADYQTNYEQKHLASAVDVAKREVLEKVCGVLEGIDTRAGDDMADAWADEIINQAKTAIKNLLDDNKTV